MKATRAETPFQPVILTLETQAEVDAIFAVLNHKSTREALGFPHDAYLALNQFQNDYSPFHSALNKIIKPAS